MNRSQIERGFETAQSDAKPLAGERHDDDLAVGISSAHATQGFESRTTDGVVLNSFVAKAHDRTLIIQNAHSESKGGQELGVRILEVTDTGDLKPAAKELHSSGIFEPTHAPRGRYAKQNWSCVKNGCGTLDIPCGALSDPAYFACLGITYAYMLGACCEKWEPNPYD